LGEDTLKFISPTLYNDNKWHIIDASRQGNEALLKVDGEEISRGKCSGSSTELLASVNSIKYFFTCRSF